MRSLLNSLFQCCLSPTETRTIRDRLASSHKPRAFLSLSACILFAFIGETSVCWSKLVKLRHFLFRWQKSTICLPKSQLESMRICGFVRLICPSSVGKQAKFDWEKWRRHSFWARSPWTTHPWRAHSALVQEEARWSDTTRCRPANWTHEFKILIKY